MSDLSGRRGRVLGTDTAGNDRTLVKSEVPQVELTRYAIDLRSLSHGAASFTRSFVPVRADAGIGSNSSDVRRLNCLTPPTARLMQA